MINNCRYLVLQASPGLVLPVERTTGLGCIPEGRIVSYECTVTDPLDPPVASTVWLGTAFNCPSQAGSLNNRITIPHNQVLSGSTGGCSSLSAMSIGFNENDYTSRLSLTATNDLNGLTIICTLSDVVIVGNDTIIVGGEYNTSLYTINVSIPDRVSPSPSKYHGRRHFFLIHHRQLDPTLQYKQCGRIPV